MTTGDITGAIIGAAITVHRELGPGLMESSYETCLCYELIRRGLLGERQKKVPLIYRGVDMQCGYRIDVVGNDTVIVELKAVERIEGVHVAAVLTYLKLSKHSVALLINFNVTTLRDGIRRIVLWEPVPARGTLRAFNRRIRTPCPLCPLW